MSRTRVALVAAVAMGLGVVATAGSAGAAEITHVASSFDVGNPFDFNLRLTYFRTLRRAQLRREAVAASPGDYYRYFDDLSYSQVTDTLNLRTEFGLYHDLQLSVDVPIIVFSQNRYAFADGINPLNSTTIADGICTADPASPCGSLARTGRFNGQERRGVPYVGLGLTWGALSQKRDETKPNLNLGFEARISVGDVMQRDNRSVSDGVHQLIWFIIASKRLGFVDPYVGFRYTLPIARSDSLFLSYGPGQDITAPRQRAAVFTGSEFIVYERPTRHQKITLELFGEIEAHFDEREYSEIWELLAGSPALEGRASEFQFPGPYQGITNIENYYRVTGRFNVNVRVTQFFQFRAGYWVAHDSNHDITFASAGIDRDGDRQVNRSNRAIAEQEANPVRRDIIDLPGRRYRLGGSNIHTLFIQGSATF